MPSAVLQENHPQRMPARALTFFKRGTELVERPFFHATPKSERRYDAGGPNSFTRLMREVSFRYKFGKYNSLFLLNFAGRHAIQRLGFDLNDIRICNKFLIDSSS